MAIPNTSPHLNIPGRAIPLLIDDTLEAIDLSTTERLLFIKIINASGLKGVMWHRNKTIATALGTAERTVQRGLSQLLTTARIIAIVTNQDPPKGRRYLCPWPTRLCDLFAQLLRAGVTPVSWMGDTDVTPDDPEIASLIKALHIVRHTQIAPNTQKNISQKDSIPNVIRLPQGR